MEGLVGVSTNEVGEVGVGCCRVDEGEELGLRDTVRLVTMRLVSPKHEVGS